MFQFPKAIVDPNWFQPYELPDAITVPTTSKSIILDIQITEEEGIGSWIEGERWMPRLLPLRDELLRSDLRLLYLAWLRTASYLAETTLEGD